MMATTMFLQTLRKPVTDKTGAEVLNTVDYKCSSNLNLNNFTEYCIYIITKSMKSGKIVNFKIINSFLSEKLNSLNNLLLNN